MKDMSDRVETQKKKKPLGSRNLALMGLFTAVVTVCAWISVPLAVPVTLQTFAVCLAGALLGAKRGGAAVFIYVLLGAAGVPVFAGFKGGLSALAGPTGGYIIGFIITAAVTGLLSAGSVRLARLILSMAAGVILCYIFGTLWFVTVYPPEEGTSVCAALMTCVVPFIFPDGVKIFLAAYLAGRLRPVLREHMQ